ncbi:hypothetical protein JTE90_003054 [Oedothorax gibbosus]|uniref:XPG N-terminal domain-containing protein n=1 Tax=Oedothorax gibbosus TaxID=931172 RepID=A0AAV6VBH3_9ARAC|nr:hypothetical protein JTE90_003054 [Oedothorax gibbosus]
MGIRGLSTFFNNNPDLSKSHKLYNTNVIIDGNNLIHLLYFSNKVDFIYGGDYHKYAKSIRKYFSSYLECNIRPIVIFDGGYDKTDRKFQTILKRSRDRLNFTQQIVKYGDCAGGVLPINAKVIFRDVLVEMGIPFAQCDFEADDQVTSLANHYNCPVLSNDSDFYIFNILNGFIRLSSVDTTVSETTNNEGDSFKYLKCSIYYVDKFLSHFPGIDRNILPLFGTLVGNDFVDSKDFSKFFNSVRFPKQKSRKFKVNERQKRIIGLLSWLAHCNLNENIKQILLYTKKERREYLKSVIDRSINGYKTQKCNLVFIIDGEIENLEKIFESETILETPCGHALPIQFVIAFHQGTIQPFFLNIINLHRTFLQAQVEDISEESSHACSRYIRQIIYGILLQHSANDEKVHEEECLCAIEEYDRRSGRLHKEIVNPIFTQDNGNNLPMLNELYTMKKSVLKDLLSSVLVKDVTLLQSVPENLELLFGCINYWLNSCSPKPREELVYALIINIIYYDVILKIIKTKVIDSSTHQSDDASDMAFVINSITEKEAEFAVQNLKKYVHKPVLNRVNPLIISTIHNFGQLQTCILYTLYLNMLLNYPFKAPKLHDMFAGTLLYNLTKDMLSRQFPQLFISELLGRQSKVNELFVLIKNKIFEGIPADFFAEIDRTMFQKKKGGKNKQKLSKMQVDTEVSDHYKELENLCLEENCNVEDVSEVYI